MSHADSIQQAINYIEANLTENISLYKAANMACFSVPHFYRVFKALTGRTVGAYVMNRRLSLAARALCTGKSTISEIAYANGFQSHDVFTRAFIREYGMPPSRYRRCGVIPEDTPFNVQNLVLEGECRTIQYEVVQKMEFAVIGMRCSAMEWDEDGAIGRLWSSFLPRVEEIGSRSAPAVMYGLCEAGNAEPGRLSYMAAVGVCPGCVPPDGMAVKRLRAQRYMQAHVPEHIAVRDAYTQTLNHVEGSGCIVDEYDFIELYEEVFRDPADNSFQLLIPVK
jgi:AraC family transcriptional regulator